METATGSRGLSMVPLVSPSANPQAAVWDESGESALNARGVDSRQAPRPALGAGRWKTGALRCALAGLGKAQGDVTSAAQHHPQVIPKEGGRWVVECPECRRDHTTSLPVGIGLPVDDRAVAEMIRDNHTGPHRGDPSGGLGVSLGHLNSSELAASECSSGLPPSVHLVFARPSWRHRGLFIMAP